MKRRVLEGKENIVMVYDAVKLWYEHYDKQQNFSSPFLLQNVQKAVSPMVLLLGVAVTLTVLFAMKSPEIGLNF